MIYHIYFRRDKILNHWMLKYKYKQDDDNVDDEEDNKKKGGKKKSKKNLVSFHLI